MADNGTTTPEAVPDKVTPISPEVAAEAMQKFLAARAAAQQVPLSDKVRKVSFSSQNPHIVAPNGDRYLVELLEIEERVGIKGADGQTLDIIIPEYIPARRTEGPNGKTELEPETLREFNRGWRACLVLRVGNGHRLETPDLATVIPAATSPDDLKAIAEGRASGPPNVESISESAMLLRPPATVPMFFAPGDVLLAERLSGREVLLQGKKYAIINQVDILAKLEGVTLSDIEAKE